MGAHPVPEPGTAIVWANIGRSRPVPIRFHETGPVQLVQSACPSRLVAGVSDTATYYVWYESVVKLVDRRLHCSVPTAVQPGNYAEYNNSVYRSGLMGILSTTRDEGQASFVAIFGVFILPQINYRDSRTAHHT